MLGNKIIIINNIFDVCLDKNKEYEIVKYNPESIELYVGVKWINSWNEENIIFISKYEFYNYCRIIP